MTIEEFDTSKLLINAARQRDQRNLQDTLVVDVDCHHYENESMAEIIEFIEDPVLRRTGQVYAGAGTGANNPFMIGSPGAQDVAGRITRYPLRKMDPTPEDGRHRDIHLSLKWMDALGVDYAMLFPGPMLLLGLHPVPEYEVAMSRAYNRWLTERVLAEEPRLKTMLYLPFNDPEASYRIVQEFKDVPGIVGFLVTSVRHNAVHENVYAKTYAAIQEAGKVLSFHTGYDWDDPTFGSPSRFVAVQAIGYPFYNVVHCVNWLCNAMNERFPELDVLWMEGGLAWVLWVNQRIDSEYRMRSSEVPGLRKLPSEYLRDMYYTSQPLEAGDTYLLEQTMRAIDAGNQVIYASNYPLPDMDVPSVIWDLEFLDDQQKRNILGENARKLFRL